MSYYSEKMIAMAAVREASDLCINVQQSLMGDSISKADKSPVTIASIFWAVSLSDSPLETLDPEALKFTVSAESRFSANSNEIRVRVEDSKNKLTTVIPRSVGTRLIGRSNTSRKRLAVSRMRLISRGE